MQTIETHEEMNYIALADWIETTAKREKLGSPWDTGCPPKGMGTIIDVDEPRLTVAIHQVGGRCDWFTRSTLITCFLEHLRENPRLQVMLPKE